MNEITALQLRDSAQQAIANIKTIESGVEYLNKVKAIEIWAKAERKDAELQNMIAEQKIRTQRVLGRLIREGQEKGEIARQDNHPGSFGASVTANDTRKTLPEIGITRNQSYTFKAIEAVPEEKFENMRQGERTDIKPSANWREVVSQPKAAEMLNVSERSIQRIKAVKEEKPELIKEIERGELTAGKAYKEVQKQRKIATIQEIVEQKKANANCME